MAGCLYRAKDIIELATRIDGRLLTYIDYARNRRDLVEVSDYKILNDDNTKYIYLTLRQDLPWGQDSLRSSMVACFSQYERNYFSIDTIWGNVVPNAGDTVSLKTYRTVSLSFSGIGMNFKWRTMAEFETYLHGIEEQVLQLHRKLKIRALDERKNAIRGAMDEYDR